MSTAKLVKHLREWGRLHIIYYPWRFISDPYEVLISEFMLHRTQVNQVIPVYSAFINQFPGINSITSSSTDEMRKMLFPLGLQWRIENMIQALFEIKTEFGEVPLSIEKLTSIRGIGDYIASATLCFSQNIPLVLIDTNIVRVIGRFYGLDLHGEARRRKIIRNAIDCSIDLDNPRFFYYSIIDLAHSLCTPTTPSCLFCPLLQCGCSFGILFAIKQD